METIVFGLGIAFGLVFLVACALLFLGYLKKKSSLEAVMEEEEKIKIIKEEKELAEKLAETLERSAEKIRKISKSAMLEAQKFSQKASKINIEEEIKKDPTNK